MRIERGNAVAIESAIWPNVGHADGTSGDLAMLAPPFIVTEDEIDEIVARFSRALELTLPQPNE